MALNIGEVEVEVWIVRAIGKKLLDARIDQLARTVSITRCSHRSFGAPQWRELRDQLAAWSVSSLFNGVCGPMAHLKNLQPPLLRRTAVARAARPAPGR